MTSPPLVGTAIPAEWTFWADQSQTPPGLPLGPRDPLGPVQVTGFTCSWALSGYGAAEAIVPIEQAGLTRAELLRFWGWRLWAFYDGRPVWAGCPVGLDDDGGTAVSLAFSELPGYLNKRQQTARVDYGPEPGTEQTVIARDLAALVSQVGVRVVTDPGPGRLRVRFYDYLEGGSLGALLGNLCEVIEGPEFRTEYTMEDGRPVCTLKIAYPRAGGATGLGIVVPAGAASFRNTWSAAQQRTRTFAVGELPEGAPADAKAPVEIVDRPQEGLPRLDEVDDWPGTVLVSTLRERALAAATTYAGPALALESRMPVAAPALGTYGVGDDVAVNLVSPFMPAGLAAVGRLAKIDADAGAGTAAWTVTIVDPPPRPAATLTARLDRLDATTTGMFRTHLQATAEET